MILLVDGDLVAYRAAASCEPTKAKLDREDEYIAILRAEDTMHKILDATGASEYKIYLSGDENFRYNVDPEYKANRKDVPRPVHLQPVREHLIRLWGASIVHGYEADDAIGIASQSIDDCVIVSLDKDLLQLPGRHYNWVRDTFTNVELVQGIRMIFWLMLVGDTTDNIEGVWQIGPKKADKILDSCNTIMEMQERVEQLYDDDERFQKNLRLVTVLTSLEEWEKVNNQYNENGLSQEQGESTTEDSQGQDLSPFQTINS